MKIYEEWRDIKGYEGIYKVSNYGNVKSFKFGREKILKPRLNKGYRFVGLSLNGKVKNSFVHQLVAKAFIDNPESLPVVNHIDGNKLNNTVDNLEWCTQPDNVRHAFRTGLIKRSPLTESQKKYISIRTKEAMEKKEVRDKLHKPRKKVTA